MKMQTIRLTTLAVALAAVSGPVTWAQDPSTTGEAAKSAPDIVQDTLAGISTSSPSVTAPY